MIKIHKKFGGIIATVILTVIFNIVSKIGLKFLEGAVWFVYSSILRIIFGCIAIFLLNKLYSRSIKSIFTNYSPKAVIVSGIGFLIYALYFIIAILIGYIPVEITELTVSLFLSRILLQQITTGFCEEALNRGLLLEGFFCTNRGKISKLIYAFASFLLFGLIHVTSGWNTYTFLLTGTIGFSFATIYLNTHNLILPMLMHFIFDIFANLVDYLQFNESAAFSAFYSANEVMIGVMFVISLVKLLNGKKSSETFE